jgi:hypothetical protein
MGFETLQAAGGSAIFRYTIFAGDRIHTYGAGPETDSYRGTGVRFVANMPSGVTSEDLQVLLPESQAGLRDAILNDWIARAGQPNGPRYAANTRPVPVMTSTPTTTLFPSTDPDGALKSVVQLFHSPPPCTLDGSKTRCPLTPRLLAEALTWRSAYWACRCQNTTFRTYSVSPLPDGAIVHVTTYWDGGPQNLDFKVLRSQPYWLIDDQTCTKGGPETSIFNRGQFVESLKLC